MKSPIRRAVEIGVLLCLIVVGSLLYLFPEVPIQYLLSETLEHIGEAGIHVRLHHISTHSILFSIEIPALSLKLEQIQPEIRLSKFFPPAWKIHWKQDFNEIHSNELTLQSPKFDLSYEGSLLGQWVFQGEVSAESAPMMESPKLHWNIRKGLADLRLESQIESKKVEVEINTGFVHSETELLKTEGKLQWKVGEFAGGGPLIVNIWQEPTGARVTVAETQNLKFSELPYGLRLENLQLQGEESLSPDKTLDVKFTLKDEGGLFSGDGDGKFNGAEKSGQFQFRLPLHFQKNLQVDHFFPELKGKTEAIAGIVNTFGKTTIRSGQIFDVSLGAKTDGISGLIEKIPFRGLKGFLTLGIDAKGNTRGSQTISLETIGKDFTLEKFHLRAEGPRKEKLTVKELSGSLLGGQIFTPPFVIHLKNGEFASEMELKNLELGKIISLLATDRLSGSGKMAGKLALRYQDDYLTISDANVQNTGPGHLSYVDETVREVKKKIDYLSEFNDLLHKGEQALVLKALDNFDYSLFRMSIDRSRGEGLTLQLHLRGKNPDLANGQPFELNLPISGNVESFLTESFLKSTMEKEAWEEKLRTRIENRQK